MDHDYEFSSYERHESWVFDLQELLHPAAYHAAIHPSDWRREMDARQAKEAAKAAKEAARSQTAAAEDEAELQRRKAEARRQFLEAKARRAAEKEAGGDSESEAPAG